MTHEPHRRPAQTTRADSTGAVSDDKPATNPTVAAAAPDGTTTAMTLIAEDHALDMPTTLPMGTPSASSQPSSTDEAAEADRFVAWLRAVAPYIHAFRGKTFVIGVPGELIAAGRLTVLVQDISLLHAMGMRIVVVYGSRPQITEQLRLRNLPDRFCGNLRVTDAAALECVKEAAGEIRLDIEAAFSQGLPNTPMQNATVHVVSGNFVAARPVGIVSGTDLLHTGVTRKIDARTLQVALQSGAVVLLSPLGFSPTGEAFNLAMEDVATAAAVALDAAKLVFLSDAPGITDAEGQLIGEISEAGAQRLLDEGRLGADAADLLRYMLRACQGGVARTHMVPFDIDGGLLLELFRHDGVGTMLAEEELEALREATLDDVASILSIIRPMEEEGILVRRDHSLIEREIEHYSVIEHDGVIFGCAALHAFPGHDIGEMAALAVSPHVQGQGDGERLLRHVEQRARAKGLKRLFVLTTRTMHWFLKRGFRPASVEDLPEGRRNVYNWNRRSQVLIKQL